MDCNGMCLKSHGDGLFIGKGLNLGTQKFSIQWCFLRTETPMIDTFVEFVGAFFKEIQPLSNFDIIEYVQENGKKIISEVVSCVMK